ncbi:MAG: nucleotidyltransferase family protein [Opitutaceae bacterium]|nr:nucleotidyltransferase family protein [Opitutaceae bacterium]
MTSESCSAGKIVGVVLAAGGSKRLGHPKQLVEIDGSPLIVRAVDALLAVPEITDILVILGAHAAKIRPLLSSCSRAVQLVDVPDWNDGLSRSIRAALAEIGRNIPDARSALFTLCDQPNLDHRAIKALVATAESTPASIVAAQYDGHPGAPCLIDQRHFEFLSRIEGDQGARALFSAVNPADIAGVDLPQLSLDLDTPEDLQQWQNSQPNAT